MVPFIIGGIALAATGYGVAKLLENDDNRDKEKSYQIKHPYFV